MLAGTLRRLASALARGLLRPLAEDDDRAAYWVRHLRHGVVLTEPSGGEVLAERLRAAVAAVAAVAAEGGVTASIRVATMSAGDDVQAVLHRADEAMYRAKTSGGDRVDVSSGRFVARSRRHRLGRGGSPMRSAAITVGDDEGLPITQVAGAMSGASSRRTLTLRSGAERLDDAPYHVVKALDQQ